MHYDIVIPEVGESVREALLTEWFVKPGERVSKGTVLFVLETDKVTLEVPADAEGVVEILVPAGEKVTVGTVVGRLRTEASVTESPPPAEPSPIEKPAPAPLQMEKEPLRFLKPQPSAVPPAPLDVFPSVAQLALEKGVDLATVRGTGPGGMITRGDVLLFLESQGVSKPATPMPFAGTHGMGKPVPATQEPSGITGRKAIPAGSPGSGSEGVLEETRKPMSPIRKRIAERLLHAKHSTAMLTTFNEVDMSRVIEFRRRFKDAFKEKYGVSLGFMSFFVKACVQGLQEIPEVNAFIDGDDIVYHSHVHMGIAVGAERGLVVPVIRYADTLSFAEIEKAIDDFVQKVRENRLQLRDLEGGTFTITNGGVFGSLLSTPILNPPQSAILGLHKIEDRPIALGGQVVIRPMMYVALSYDHRIIDGREAVTFLKRVKECIEDPERLLVGI